MTTRRIAITGTDGTGKTTVVRQLAERFADRPGLLIAFRAPQYHEGPDHPFGVLSAAIDALSELGDRENNPLLKATALFLSMTLYGDVERHLIQTYAPQVLVAERQCLADSLTYAQFYLPLLGSELDRQALAGPIEAALARVHPDAWRRVQAWLPVFQRRSTLGTCAFWQLPLYVRDLFDREPAALVPMLQQLYHADIPNQIVQLTVRPEVLAQRLAAKRGQAAAVPRELHEQAQVLAMFQAGLARSCELLRTMAPDLTICALDSSDKTIDETVADVLDVIRPEA